MTEPLATTTFFKTGHLDDPICPARTGAEASGRIAARDYRDQNSFFLGVVVDMLAQSWSADPPPVVEPYRPTAAPVQQAAQERHPQAHAGLRALLTDIGGPHGNWRRMETPTLDNKYLTGVVRTWGLTFAIRPGAASEVLLHVRPRYRADSEASKNRLAAIHVATVWLGKGAGIGTRLVVAELGVIDGQSVVVWDGPVADLAKDADHYRTAFEAASTYTETKVGIACAECPLRGTCPALPTLDNFFCAEPAPRFGTRVTGSRIPAGGSCPSRLLGENDLRNVLPASADSPASGLGRAVHHILARRHADGERCDPNDGVTQEEVALAEEASVDVQQLVEMVIDHANRCREVLQAPATLVEPAFVFYDPTADVTAHIEPDAIIASPEAFVIIDHKTTRQTIPHEHLQDWALDQWPVVAAYVELAHRGAVHTLHHVDAESKPRRLRHAGLDATSAAGRVVIDVISAEGGTTITFDANDQVLVRDAQDRLAQGANVLTSSTWITEPAPTECDHCAISQWCDDRYANSTKSA